MKWIKTILNNFHNKGKKSFDITDGFAEEHKQAIINAALTTSAQVLMSAMVMTNSHEHLIGELQMPDGSRFILKFERVKQPL